MTSWPSAAIRRRWKALQREPGIRAVCDTPEDEIDRAVALNLSSDLALTRLAAPACGRAGHIFLAGPVAGHAPFANMAVHCATKAAPGRICPGVAAGNGSAGPVRVTEIVAGRVETTLYQDLLSPDRRAALYARNTAVKPADVAAMVLAVLALPQNVDVARFDIPPTRRATKTGADMKGK